MVFVAMLRDGHQKRVDIMVKRKEEKKKLKLKKE